MANRTVSVEMQAKVGQYVAGVKEAQAATEGLNAELNDVGKHDADFAEAVKSASELATASAAVAREVDKSGTQMKESAVDARFLADELKKARTAALEAAAAFALTGDKAKLLEFRKQTNYASELARVDKALLSDAAKAGTQVGQAVSKGFNAAVKGPEGLWEIVGSILTNPVGLAATLAAAALIGGEIGGSVGGAVIAGLGVAGIGAGVAASLSDPRVKAAEQGLKSSFADLAAGIGSDFAGPTTDAIHILRAEVDHLRPSIRSTLDELAPMTTVLAKGAASGMDIFWEHLSKALVNSKPLIEWTAREIPKLADDVGGLIEEMSKHTDEAQFALDSLFGIVRVGIGILEVFTKIGAGAIGAVQGIQEAASKIPGLGDVFSRAHGELHTLDTTSQYAAKSAEELAAEQKALASAVDAANRSFEDQIKQMLAADNAAIDYQQNIDDLTQSVQQNGRSLDITTQAGRNNKRTLDQLVESILKNYESNIKAGLGADKANLAFLQQEGALQRQMKALGFSKAAIDEYIGRLEALRYAAISAANAINDTGVGHTHHDSYAQGGFRHAAAGMFIPPSDPGTTLVGEPQTGGEWLIPARGISQGRAADLIGGAARGYGLDVGRAWQGAGSGDLTALIVETRRTNSLLAGLNLSVTPDGLALTVRRGNKLLNWTG